MSCSTTDPPQILQNAHIAEWQACDIIIYCTCGKKPPRRTLRGIIAKYGDMAFSTLVAKLKCVHCLRSPKRVQLLFLRYPGTSHQQQWTTEITPATNPLDSYLSNSPTK